MHILWTILFTCLAYVALAVLASIIILRAIGFGGKSSPFAEPAISPCTDEELQAFHRAKCECRCHRESMYPGMRCLDCFGEPCDEGTAECE
jgi:hypothetical protein